MIKFSSHSGKVNEIRPEANRKKKKKKKLHFDLVVDRKIHLDKIKE